MRRSLAYLVSCGLLCLGASTGARAADDAIVGQPFGVGRVSIPLPADAGEDVSRDSMVVSEAHGRVLYPVVTGGRLRKILGEILGGEGAPAPGGLTAWFLFTGNAPLELTCSTPRATAVTVTPQAPRDRRAHSRLLTQWWREYNAAVREQVQQGDYPPLVQTYLTSMLSRRLGLEPPLLSRIREEKPAEALQALELLMGLESLRLATMRRTSLGAEGPAEVADCPLPAAVQWTPLAAPDAAPDVAIEPIAMRVPEGWFYIRFGSFENYLWYDRLQQDYGNLQRMIVLRGYDAQLGQRMQRQLALRQNFLADLLGPAVIADVALIGTDLYLREGPALGVLFQARNGLLGGDLDRQRAAALAEEKSRGATLSKVTVAGREVSFLSTPDNRLRSFYVVDGDYHFVTTSRTLVEKFLAVGRGPRSLGGSAEFRHARTILPTSREDTIFVYFSSAFFQGLVSPQYQVEVARRLQAATDLELLLMATWAAKLENRPAETVPDLIRAGLLPPVFGRRPDGGVSLVADNPVRDSLRGARGSFLPIPDVELPAVTAGEATRVARTSSYYGSQWKQMDPLMIGVKRFALDRQGRERIVIDAHISPFAEAKYGWLVSLLGEPTKVRIRPAEGDVITAQASVRGGLLASAIPAHHLFLGVQDAEPLSALASSSGLLKTLRILQTTPGYLGAWPKPGFLDWLPLGLAGTAPDAAGYSRLPFNVWRRQWGDFSVLSFDPKLLAAVTPELRPEEAENEAQVRIHVGDLSQAKLQTWVNSLTYSRALEASRGNARLLQALSQQLGVPREQALQAGEQLLDAGLVCPLGGTYRLAQSPGEVPHWVSTNWPATDAEEPAADYRTPVLEWFRGLDADLTKYGDGVVLHTTLDMQRKAKEAKADLPLFKLDWLGGSKTDKKSPRETPPKPSPQPAAGAPPAVGRLPSGAREF